MTQLLEIGATNAVFATLLAVVVWMFARRWRQPVFVHLLWVLVLVKLITPPLVPIPWRFATDAPMAASIAATAGDESTQFDANSLAVADDTSAGGDEDVSYDVALTSPPRSLRFADISWTVCVSGIWLTGSTIWLAIAVGRLAQFHLALADASPSSGELRRLAGDAAAKLGVRRYRICVTSGRLSPLVWPIGRPTIVIPQCLLDVLSKPELQAILMHEFAHLRRKDHWVRWLELVVTGIYWWHPIVWYARREIQQTEERACDAWVVQLNPSTAKEYATALFQAVQCATETLRPVPVVASRVTSGGDLKERIENVLNATWNAELSTGSRRSLWFLALCILPLSLTSVYAIDAETAAPRDAADPARVQPAINAPALEPNDHEKLSLLLEPSEHEKLSVRESAPIDLDDVAALREQVAFLDEQFKRADALYRAGAVGGTLDRWAMTGYELAKARGELALAEGNRADATARFAEAQNFAEQSLKATSAQYHADRVTLDTLLLASKNLTEIKRRSIQLRRGTGAATSESPASPDDSDLRRELAQLSLSNSNTPSLKMLRKMIAQQKNTVDRLQSLADKQVVSATELAQVKNEYELGIESLRQAERVLESRQLLVELAEVEYAQAIEANKQAPESVSELELRRKKLMVELAKAKVRELGE